jgi:recombination protein RecT
MNAGRAVAQRTRDPLRDQFLTLRNQLDEMREKFLEALPRTIPTDRFVRMAWMLVQNKPELLDCDRKSLLVALQRSASDGLLPDGREATVVPFKSQEGKGPRIATYMPMYQGLIKQIRNTGDLASVAAHIVHKNDEFSYVQGDEEKLTHVPLLGGDRGEPIAVYCIIRTKDGGIYRSYLSKTDVMRIRDSSPTHGPKTPWNTHPMEMWKKSAIRACSKYAPKSTELERYLDVMRPSEDAPHHARLREESFSSGVMPDDNSMESTRFHLKTSALEALGLTEKAEAVHEIWKTYSAEMTKINQQPDIEVEAAKNDRLETLRQKQPAN